MAQSMFEQAASEISAIEWTSPTILRAFAGIAMLPIFWTIFARLEYHTRLLTMLWGFGNSRRAVYVFALLIFIGCVLRFLVVSEAMSTTTQSQLLKSIFVVAPVGYILYALGMTFICMSIWKLGIVGYNYGDHFGILMESKIESFPFNIFSAPMYTGNSMFFCGCSLIQCSWVGLVLSLWLYVCYEITLFIEEPFTAKIYAQKKAKIN